MVSVDGNYVIVFDGEIYNYIELREELKKLGQVFVTESDTEILLNGYKEWGIELQNKLNGMWAFAIWDKTKDRLFLSRDRLGEKPLYYNVSDKSLIFGSEIKAILAYGVFKEPNMEVLDLYLSLGYIPAPYTFYKNILKLEPGSYLIVNKDDILLRKYWDLPSLDEENMITDKEEIYKRFQELFYDSVKLRMRSDVPFGVFLSGGLDSSSVVAIMSDIVEYPIETFTIGFQDKDFDERILAKEVADKFKTNHHEYIVGNEDLENALNKVSYHCDEPFGDSSAIPTGYVSEFARQKVKMVLTGDGGDEVLSGYTSYQGEKFAYQFQNAFPAFARSFVPAFVRFSSRAFRGKVRFKLNRISNVTESSNKDFIDRLTEKSSWLDSNTKYDLLSDQRSYIKIDEYLRTLYKNNQIKDTFYKLMYFHFKVSLPDGGLNKVDKMSMAYSLETRIPFLDHRLVEFMVRIHKDVKLHRYERKSILRNTIGKKLPRNLLRAPKHGFVVPLWEWFKRDSFFSFTKSLYKEDFGLNSDVIKVIIEKNKRGEMDYGNFIWMLIILKKWLVG